MFSKTQQGIIAVLVVIGLLGICFIALALFAPASPPATIQPIPTIVQPTPIIVPTATTQVYLLELLAMNDIKSSDRYFQIHGQIKNISQQPLNDIEAVISLYDSEDNFIMSDSALIKNNPLLPGQVSAFRVTVIDNPKITRYSTDFKHYGGALISVKDSR